MEKFILASASPRRKLLLEGLGVSFDVVPPLVEEDLTGGDSPRDLAEGLARKKAREVSSRVEGIVVAADTIVVMGTHVLGKPENEEEAFSMLRLLSGSSHVVVTGLCIIDNRKGLELMESEMTTVNFRELTDEEINDYIRTGEPFDKAGGYGIQGKGALLVSGIGGCYYNVVGLPLAKLQTMLSLVGINLL